MNTWTSAAKDELEKYLAAIRRPLEQAGADAAEVMEDLKRHIEEEIALARLRVVTVTDLKPMLARIGEPAMNFQAVNRTVERPEATSAGVNGFERTEPRTPSIPANGSPEVKRNGVHKPDKPEKPPVTRPQPPGFWLLICGVIYPAVTLAIEWITGFCASHFFNPIPTLGHVLLVALTPAVNGYVWWALRNGREERFAQHLGWLSALAIGISLVYSIVFLPLVLPGLIALIFFGMGLLPLTPLVTLVSIIALRRKLKQKLASSKHDPLRGLWPGIAAAMFAFLLVDLSFVGSTMALQMAARPDRENGAIRWLRKFGHEKTLLRACYTRTASSSNFAPILQWLLPQDYQVTADQARRVYFQVYGRPFSSVPAPGPRNAMLIPNRLFEPFDPERGGEKVGSPVPGLALETSRIDATVEPNGALAYLEWIFEFRNAARSQSEARAEILLPPGASVSRLTLWVNGEEREAAFAGKSEVRQAYQNIVAQRRDPVLVTSAGRDLILMQCFPVPPSGGTMKVRVGMTVPLQIDSAKNGVLRWPVIRERNFALDEKLEHTFWLDSPTPLEPLGLPLKTERTQSGHFMAHGNLHERGDAVLQPAVLIRRDGMPDQSWVRDSRADDGSFIVQQILPSANPPLRDIVLVIDGSASLAQIAPKLEHLAIPRSVRIIFAAEQLRELSLSIPNEWRRVVSEFQFAGGQDNLPALERAWDIAAESGSGVVIWVHGPQPILLSGAEGLKQRFERRRNAVEFFDLQVERGPNAILPVLPSAARAQAVSMHRPVDQTLTQLLLELTGGTTRYETVREKQMLDAAPAGAQSNLHLARAWAADEIVRLVQTGRRDDAIQLAGLYQLVSEVSGAVVLETAEQFRNAGLQPVGLATVPVVPEPGTWALLILGAGIMLALRRFQLRRQ